MCAMPRATLLYSLEPVKYIRQLKSVFLLKFYMKLFSDHIFEDFAPSIKSFPCLENFVKLSVESEKRILDGNH